MDSRVWNMCKKMPKLPKSTFLMNILAVIRILYLLSDINICLPFAGSYQFRPIQARYRRASNGHIWSYLARLPDTEPRSSVCFVPKPCAKNHLLCLHIPFINLNLTMNKELLFSTGIKVSGLWCKWATKMSKTKNSNFIRNILILVLPGKGPWVAINSRLPLFPAI